MNFLENLIIDLWEIELDCMLDFNMDSSVIYRISFTERLGEPESKETFDNSVFINYPMQINYHR